ncbi:SigE family RNA polymerase sigma factor [Streptomyces sp. NBC_01241]|uniref:SigE family RNA polymerase sigma factor n=1 Tax=Streptomyces sp. NBC_01241 TaxID=2903794 RepID=UPI00352DE588|nr:SigE family RNA polymerase sigma factor [Streptomyces sp. NBC_01241]
MRRSQESAFREFAAVRMGHLFRSACLLTSGDTYLAEDLVQETLGRMYVVWGRSSKLGNPAAYAQTVLVRVFLAHQRRRSAGERPSDEIPEVSETAAQGDASLRLMLLDALRKLPAKDRAVVVLRYWEDRSVTETADVLNVSSAAVRTRSTRALARLRVQLGGSIGEFAAH